METINHFTKLLINDVLLEAAGSAPSFTAITALYQIARSGPGMTLIETYSAKTSTMLSKPDIIAAEIIFVVANKTKKSSNVTVINCHII